jgi:hypothetical protein
LIGAVVKTSVIDTAWITLPTEERNAAEAKSGVNPENAAVPGRGFTNGAVFFWGKILRNH